MRSLKHSPESNEGERTEPIRHEPAIDRQVNLGATVASSVIPDVNVLVADVEQRKEGQAEAEERSRNETEPADMVCR